MTLSEFKAWFEGYTEGLEAAPTKAQFERIKEKVKEITGTPITYPVYIDRYVAPYRSPYPMWGTAGGIARGAIGITPHNMIASGGTADPFDSLSAMYAAGKAEAAMN